MKKPLFIIVSVLLVTASLPAQTVLFSEDFESGSPSTDWELYRAGEEALEAADMTSAPATLADGGDYVGYIQDADVSYSGAAIALAGDTTDMNYTIEGDVYCYNNHSGGSAYTGLVVYADSSHQGSASHGYYVKLVADFDSDMRLRLYNNQLNMTTFQYTFSHSIDATGLDNSEGWHHMKVRVETLDDGTTQYTCYYDGENVGEFVDDGVDRVTGGQYGVYAFQMDDDGIAGYFDNIVVTSNEGLSTTPDPAKPDIPAGFHLAQNYPNPFNPSTKIVFTTDGKQPVTLSIYNLRGEHIQTLVNNLQTPGTVTLTWDGRDRFGNRVPTGVYLYSLSDGIQRVSKKMILMK